MFRRTMVMCLALLLAGAVFAGELVELKPVEFHKSRGPVVDELDWGDEDFRGEIFRYGNDVSEYYLSSGSQGDTMCVVFQPLAPCSIYVAQVQWNSEGSFQTFLWDYNDEAGESGRSVDRGTSPVSPLGDLVFGPFVNSCTGSNEWEYLFNPDDLEPVGGGIEWDMSKFVVGFVKTQDDGHPQPLADDVTGRRFTYTWMGGPWTDNEDYEEVWGSYSSNIAGATVVDLMIRVLVTYTENAPPFISSMSQLPNTINGSKDCKVTAKIIDGEDNDFTASLLVSMNGGDATSYDMTDADGDDIFEAEFALAAADSGSQFNYWIEATDSEDASNTNEDGQLFFTVIELMNPDAHMLVVADNMGERIDVLTSYLDSLGSVDVSYELWDVENNKGLDEFTVNGGMWNTIFVCGWGVTDMPAREWDDSPFAHRFMTGCNIIFSDMDYFFAQVPDEEEPTFSEGDFAFDCFGIASGSNDVQPTDTAFFGVSGDPVSGAFADEAYVIDPAYSGNWADFVVANAEAEVIFEGAEIGRGMALKKEDGDQKTAYFAFDMFSTLVVDSFLPYPDDYPDYWIVYYYASEDFVTLMDDLLEWVGPGVYDVEETPVNAPAAYTLSQNYPNPFNPTTSIAFSIPVAENVTLKVFNITGQEVATLYNGFTQPGSKSITFDASDFASGIYLYKLETGSVTMTRKMVLMK
ncbi:MAG: T9SS type A sorting domain-containing protein [Candidatus Electryonea clarkiae]|nr:T9SS type A sorting domain-containing protein [Candidatus Electryonea clarkiae]MDP8286860.1 T9SS type A sorting domain-containing protein [Candidatus Electryonea clarkiae]